MKSFETAIGQKLSEEKTGKICSDQNQDFQNELRELLQKYCARSVENLTWPLDLSQDIPNLPTLNPSENDLKRFQILKTKILQQKMQDFESEIKENMAVIDNENLCEIIDDLLDGKPIEKLQIQEENFEAEISSNQFDAKNPLAWIPVDSASELESISASGQIIFDGDLTKIDIDDEYFDEEGWCYGDENVAQFDEN